MQEIGEQCGGIAIDALNKKAQDGMRLSVLEDTVAIIDPFGWKRFFKGSEAGDDSVGDLSDGPICAVSCRLNSYHSASLFGFVERTLIRCFSLVNTFRKIISAPARL
jgi:hypothetical protein